MNVYMCKFTNIDGNQYYVNASRIEYALFIDIPNAPHLKRAYIRCGEGLIDTQVSVGTADRIKAYLDSFV